MNYLQVRKNQEFDHMLRFVDPLGWGTNYLQVRENQDVAKS